MHDNGQSFAHTEHSVTECLPDYARGNNVLNFTPHTTSCITMKFAHLYFKMYRHAQKYDGTNFQPSVALYLCHDPQPTCTLKTGGEILLVWLVT